MYLSRVILNWAQAENPYEQHRALWHLFPERPRDQRDFLFRVENSARGQGAQVIMQSEHMPLHSQAVELRAVKRLKWSLRKGQRLRFRVRANPVKTIKDESKGKRIKNGISYTRTVRVPLIHEEQQRDWLVRKFSGSASLVALSIQRELALNFRNNKEQRSGKIQPVLFGGTLLVEEPDTLVKLMQSGIGPAKSFGCGLLSLAAT